MNAYSPVLKFEVYGSMVCFIVQVFDKAPLLYSNNLHGFKGTIYTKMFKC